MSGITGHRVGETPGSSDAASAPTIGGTFRVAEMTVRALWACGRRYEISPAGPVPLSAAQWAATLDVGLVVITAAEADKWMRRRG
ncbi:MAG: hypothetical protein ACYCVL_03375 [Gemmatimonadaceae bacterium]